MVGCGSFDGGRENSTNDQKYCAGTAVDEVGTVAAEKRSAVEFITPESVGVTTVVLMNYCVWESPVA